MKAAYVPKAGYPGTLAPGINFKEDCPFESLPLKVLHPWPAMQQIQWHVRWPPSHPMIPPPLLWAALNNMFPEVVLKLFTCYDYHYYFMFAFTTISTLIIVDDKIVLDWLYIYLMMEKYCT